MGNSQIEDRLKIIAPYTVWIRTFGTGSGLKDVGEIAHKMGLKIAIGAWLSNDLNANNKEINELINESKNRNVDLAIVGDGTLYNKILSEDQLINYIKQVKQEAPGINVTTVEPYNELTKHPKVMDECDVIMYSSFPYSEGVSINNAIIYLEDNHNFVVNQARGKQVIIAETGWPSSGNTTGSAVPSPENASKYFNDFVSWARNNNVQYFYFEAFDEEWKAAKEGPQGAHWGIWDKDGNIKAGFGPILQINETEPISPVADFTTNVISGYAPLTVQFNDNSQNATGWTWSFGDGATSNEQNPSHTYSTAGTYNVNLTVSNANGNAYKTATITVLDGSSGGSSGGSGSGGGGGAGGSPEPQSNVEAKELSQTFIASGSPVKFDFLQKATPVVNISFDSKKTAGKTTTIVEMLKEKSTLVTGSPSDEVYKHLNIWVGNAGYATEKNIENANVSFKVEKSWIQDKNISTSSITLNRYNDTKWDSLPTTQSGEDAKYLYFAAETPGLSSPFAIIGKKIASEAVNTTPSETQSEPNIGSLEAPQSSPESQPSHGTNNSLATNYNEQLVKILSNLISVVVVLLFLSLVYKFGWKRNEKK